MKETDDDQGDVFAIAIRNPNKLGKSIDLNPVNLANKIGDLDDTFAVDADEVMDKYGNKYKIDTNLDPNWHQLLFYNQFGFQIGIYCLL